MTDDGKNLQDRFGANTASTVQQDYAADSDLSRVLLNELRHMMQGSATARRLMKMADDQGVTIKFMKGREETVYVPEHKWVFMSITPRTKATSRLALLYAGALREAEQNILGFTRPGQSADDESWATQNVVKNLDIIRNVCIIVKEITEANQQDSGFLDSLEAIGYGYIYQALINHATEDELLRLYANKEQINIKEG